MVEDNPKRPLRRVGAIAIVAAAVVAAGLALYVRPGLHGNNTASIADAGGASAPSADCAGKAAEARKLGALATGGIAAMSPADPPVSLAGLSFHGPDGKPMTLGQMKGKTILLNVWASWCAPCRAEMPALDKLEAQAGGPDFQVVAVNVDTGDPGKPEKFLHETGVKHLELFRDDTMGLFNSLKERGLALGLPVTLLIDKESCMLTDMNGPGAWASAEARRFVKAAVAG